MEVLAGRRVVLTRPEPGSLAGGLAALGAAVGHVPLIEIGPPAGGGDALRAALDELGSFDWLVVTSANGAAAVGDAAADSPGVRLAAVGSATARRLAELAGRAVDLIPPTASGDGLLAAFPDQPARVLLAQGDLASDRLAAGLRSKGHDVLAVEAYTTRLRAPSVAEIEELASADAIVLASGSAAEALQEASASGLGGAIVTIGPKTAAAARSLGLDVAAVAESPTDDAVIAAVVTALR